jgi:hypothetical protein
VQAKTQRRLELPLLAEVDHALVSYIREGRPSCPAREIFVRHVVPIAPLARRNNLWSVMGRVLPAAGVEILTGERGFVCCGTAPRRACSGAAFPSRPSPTSWGMHPSTLRAGMPRWIWLASAPLPSPRPRCADEHPRIQNRAFPRAQASSRLCLPSGGGLPQRNRPPRVLPAGGHPFRGSSTGVPLALE